MSANPDMLKYDARYKRIRLLRKKLKQIETLKLLPRKRNSEEDAKIRKQDVFRDELLDLLAEQLPQAHENVFDNTPEEAWKSSEEESLPRFIDSEREDEQPAMAISDKPEVIQQQAGVIRSSEKHIADIPTEVPLAKAGFPVDNQESDLLKVKRRTWAKKYFDLTALEGHTDIIRSVDINLQHIVSSSRDTSLKVWNRRSRELLHNLGGHRGQVNCVRLMKCEGVTNSKIVSGSEDCTVRFWDTASGMQVKEVYVYNSVTCLEFLSSGQQLVAGLDGGKLEVYNAQNLTHLLSHSLQTDRITCLSVQVSVLAVGGSDGFVTVLEWTGSSFRCLYTLEEQLVVGVKSLLLDGELIIIGDEGANIKLIHWRQNRVTALANHTSEFGVTDALCAAGSCLLSSAYDYDSGTGFLNVRDSSQHKYDYLSSISDSDVMHILSVAACGGDDSIPLTIVTGGTQLVIWEEDRNRSVDSVKCRPRRMTLADDQLHSDSDDYDEDSEVTDSEMTDSEVSQSKDLDDGGWWCTLL
ncbi:uncharacterized protein [Watersipora subatra]|uniref:uncharacterized protein n=1 Tax=Watersipora subatra TaxID=2589382 RepID=UPI00355C3DE4